MLYSYQSQEPKLLPQRIRLADRSTRTSLNELSPEELLSLGFTGPYLQPTYNKSTEKVVWNSQNLQYEVIPLTQEELNIQMEKELQEKNKNIDYIGFWNAFILSPLYNKLRLSSSEQLAVNTFCTELIALFSDAKNGNANTLLIQNYLNILFFVFDFTSQEKTEIEELLINYNLSLLYTIPDQNFISSHTYDPITNTIL